MLSKSNYKNKIKNFMLFHQTFILPFSGIIASFRKLRKFVPKLKLKLSTAEQFSCDVSYGTIEDLRYFGRVYRYIPCTRFLN